MRERHKPKFQCGDPNPPDPRSNADPERYCFLERGHSGPCFGLKDGQLFQQWPNRTRWRRKR